MRIVVVVVWMAALALALAWEVQEVRAATAASDVAALAAIKAQLAPFSVRASSCVESWDFSFDPCLPASPRAFVCGLLCRLVGNEMRVISVTLSGSGYKGTLSQGMGNLSALQSADLSGNSFEGSIPRSLGNLKQLLWLDLSWNRLSGEIPASLADLPNLHYLSLRNNLLAGSIPASFSRLESLERLNVARNRLTGGLDALQNLTHLAYLDASNNLLSGSLVLRLPPRLLQLVVRGNRFAGSLPASWKLASQLAVLDLSSNNLIGTVGSFLYDLPGLQQLNLSRNRFTGFLDVGRLEDAGSQLLAMDLSYNELRGLLPVGLAKLEMLTALDLSHNFLTGNIPDEYAQKAAAAAGIEGIRPFSQLFLDDNYLTDPIPALFFTISYDAFSASFTNNCFRDCPAQSPFCQDTAQKSETVCATYST